MYWKVITKDSKKEFFSAQQAIAFAKTSFRNNSQDEVFVEECGSKACIKLLKFSVDRDISKVNANHDE
mgnify:FL=1